MIALALDASTYEGTVAIIEGARVVAEGTAAMRGRDAERLMPAVEAALRNARVATTSVDRIVCGAGPGSFTSLRIAGSLAKGMALGRNKPLFAVSSLALIVAANATEPGRYLAALDAIRGEYFAAAFEFDGAGVIADGEPTLVAKPDVAALASRHSARLVGPGFGDRWAPHARGVIRLQSMLATGPVSLSDWEPTYGRLAEAQVRLEAASK